MTTLTPDEIEEIGLTLYGEGWRRDLGAAIGVSRQQGYTLAKNGASGSQGAALVGLLARERARAQREHDEAIVAVDALLERFDTYPITP